MEWEDYKGWKISPVRHLVSDHDSTEEWRVDARNDVKMLWMVTESEAEAATLRERMKEEVDRRTSDESA
jgi:hypothetical protein